MGPPVSVVMPAYNCAPFVEAAMRSVLDQTLGELELIVIDDGSTDGTGDVARGIDDPRARVVEQSNGGVVAALNRGLAEATGSVFARMDGDDLSDPDRLARQHALLDDDPGAVVVGCSFRRVSLSGAVLSVEPVVTEDDDLRREMYVANPFAGGSMTIRTAALRSIGGFRAGTDSAEDYDVAVRLCEIGRLRAAPAVLYSWRQNAGGLTASASDRQSAIAGEVAAGYWSSRPVPLITPAEVARRARRYRALPDIGPLMEAHYLSAMSALGLRLARRGPRARSAAYLGGVAVAGPTGWAALAGRVRREVAHRAATRRGP
jgi:hypothetical protein